MKIYHQANLVTSFSLVMLLLVLLTGQYVATQTQLQQQKELLHSQVAVLLAADLGLDQSNRVKALERIPQLTTLTILDSQDNTLSELKRTPVNNVPFTGLLHTIGLDTEPQQAHGSQLKVSFEIDNATVLLRYYQHTLMMIVGWLTLLVLSIAWMRGGVDKPLSNQLKQLQKMIEKMGQAEASETSASEGLATEFRSIGDGLQNIQKEVIAKLHMTQNELEAVRKAAYLDHLTGLPNRNQFLLDMPELLATTTANTYGVLAIVRTTALNTLNRTRGYQEGDNFINHLARIVRDTAAKYAHSAVYRLNTSEFAVILERGSHKDAEAFSRACLGHIREVEEHTHIERSTFIGVTHYNSHDALGQLLAQCDGAATIAQTRDGEDWFLYSDKDESRAQGEQIWREQIEQLIERKNLNFAVQTIKLVREDSAFTEIRPVFDGGKGQELDRRTLLAMADRLNLAEDLDRVVIDQLLKFVQSNKSLKGHFTLPLATTSVHSRSFQRWLDQLLSKSPEITKRCIVSVSEQGLERDTAAAKALIKLVHSRGARILVNRFGLGITSLRFFKELKPDYIQIDPSYMDDVETDKTVQYFLRLIVDLAHRIEVKVLATGVEKQAQKYVVEGLNIDGIQGDWVSPEKLLSQPKEPA